MGLFLTIILVDGLLFQNFDHNRRRNLNRPCFLKSTKFIDVVTKLPEIHANGLEIDPFHNYIQFEAKDAIPCAARYLHRIIMLQLHVQNSFMCC